jgi:hypothetical protein
MSGAPEDPDRLPSQDDEFDEAFVSHTLDFNQDLLDFLNSEPVYPIEVIQFGLVNMVARSIAETRPVPSEIERVVELLRLATLQNIEARRLLEGKS